MHLFSREKTEDILKDISNKHLPSRIFQLVLGVLLIAISFNLFFLPTDLVFGGVSGLSIITKRLFGMSPTIAIAIFSVFLLFVSIFALGKKETLGSLIGTILYPIFVQLTSNIGSYIHIDKTQMLLIAIFGAVIYGIGAGLVFKAGFTTGGTDILNKIVAKYAKVSMGTALILTDGLIVLGGAFIFGFTKLMYAFIVLYIISILTDKVILGISDSKAFYIITEEEEKVKDYIINGLHHSATVFDAKGGYTKEKQKVLLCVIPTRDYFKLKEGIHEIDKDAFFVVTDAYEVFGGE